MNIYDGERLSGHLNSRPDGEGWKFITNTRDAKGGIAWGKTLRHRQGYEFVVVTTAYDGHGHLMKEHVAIWARKPEANDDGKRND